MSDNHITKLKEKARAHAKIILSDSNAFRNMTLAEQRDIYKNIVSEQMDLLQGQNGGGYAAEMRRPVRRRRGPQKAGDLIDDERHEKGFEEGVDAFEDLVESVDFPQFVRDLLKAVFDANISVMKAQTDDYIRLMKEATTGLASFIKQIDDTTTFAYLAENNPDQFNISVEEDADGSEKMELTDPKGEKVDVEDNEVKAKIMDAKIKMAQEHRSALREMILMGVTRLVVEKGEIEAEVNFEFKGTRKVDKKDKAVMQKQKSRTRQFKASGGLIGSIFGGPSGSSTTTTRQTQLSVSSAKSKAEDELKAKLRGFVRIQFKTDYFKLDNFATMYGPSGQGEQQTGATAPAALPPGKK